MPRTNVIQMTSARGQPAGSPRPAGDYSVAQIGDPMLAAILNDPAAAGLDTPDEYDRFAEAYRNAVWHRRVGLACCVLSVLIFAYMVGQFLRVVL